MRAWPSSPRDLGRNTAAQSGMSSRPRLFRVARRRVGRSLLGNRRAGNQRRGWRRPCGCSGRRRSPARPPQGRGSGACGRYRCPGGNGRPCRRKCTSRSRPDRNGSSARLHRLTLPSLDLAATAVISLDPLDGAISPNATAINCGPATTRQPRFAQQRALLCSTWEVSPIEDTGA